MGKYWKLGDRWAWITSRGKRGISKSKATAMSKAGAGTSKSKSRSGSTTSKGKGGGRKIFGTVGWKGFLAAIFSLAILRIIINRLTGGGVPGEYVDSVSMIGAGAVGKATGIGTAHLLMPGVVLGISKLIEDVVTPGGLYTLPTLGAQIQGGYDL